MNPALRAYLAHIEQQGKTHEMSRTPAPEEYERRIGDRNSLLMRSLEPDMRQYMGAHNDGTLEMLKEAASSRHLPGQWIHPVLKYHESRNKKLDEARVENYNLNKFSVEDERELDKARRERDKTYQEGLQGAAKIGSDWDTDQQKLEEVRRNREQDRELAYAKMGHDRESLMQELKLKYPNALRSPEEKEFFHQVQKEGYADLELLGEEGKKEWRTNTVKEFEHLNGIKKSLEHIGEVQRIVSNRKNAHLYKEALAYLMKLDEKGKGIPEGAAEKVIDFFTRKFARELNPSEISTLNVLSKNLSAIQFDLIMGVTGKVATDRMKAIISSITGSSDTDPRALSKIMSNLKGEGKIREALIKENWDALQKRLVPGYKRLEEIRERVGKEMKEEGNFYDNPEQAPWLKETKKSDSKSSRHALTNEQRLRDEIEEIKAQEAALRG